MGRMIDGAWVTDEDFAARSSNGADGSWQRTPAVLRDWVTRDGRLPADGVPDDVASDGESEALPYEPGRYHLYGAINCPWAHRVALARTVLGLEGAVGLSNCAPRRTDQGWVFDPAAGYRDDLHGASALHELYRRSDPRYSGRVTTPVLWDRRRERIVSNESADILRMMTTQMSDGALYPRGMRDAIDALSARLHRDLNNGVYRAGFASAQEPYEAAARDVFALLDELEVRLAREAEALGVDGTDPATPGPYLHGAALTESDLRLFPTLARFDVAYHAAFRCNLYRVSDRAHLWAYARRIHALPGVAATVDQDIYRRGYHSPSEKRNPHGIVPLGPQIDWAA